MKLMQGDCLELMREIPDGSVDMVLCDPPYGVTACKWDSVIPFEQLWQQYRRIIKRNGVICLFGNEPFSSMMRMAALDWFKYDWIWLKTIATGFAQAKNMPLKIHEIISVFSPGSVNHKSCTREDRRTPYYPQGIKIINKERGGGIRKFSHVYNGRPSHKERYIQEAEGYPKSVLQFESIGTSCKERKHPTQKPVALLEYLIKTYTNQGETVLDNTMGSGSTGVACVNTGRDFIGIELDRGYFETACMRIEEAQAQCGIEAVL